MEGKMCIRDSYKDNRRSLKMWIDVAEPADYLKIVCYYAGDC